MASVNGSQTQADGGSSTTVASASLAITAGNLIVVGVAWVDNSGNGTAAVTDTAGNTYTTGASLLNSGTTRSQMFYTRAATTANVVVTATMNAAVPYRSLIVDQYSNIITSGSPLDVEATPATGNGTTPISSTFTTSAANDLVVAFLAGNAATAGGPGYALRYSGSYASLEDMTVSSASAGNTAAFTTPTGQWNVHAMVFKQAAAVVPVVVGRNAAGVTYSPLAWDDDGTSKIANSNNSAVKFNFTGTSLVATIPAMGSLAAYPTYRVYIDTAPYADITPAAGQTSLMLASGLSAGTHTCRLVLKGTPLNDRWSGAAGLNISSYTLDNGATISAPTGVIAVLPKIVAVWGDSISEGERVYSTAAPPTGSDGTLAIWPQVADALGAELAPMAYGGQGYEQAGVGGVPTYLSAYATYNSSNRSRISGGLYVQQPDDIFDWHGTNGTTTQSDVATMIANHRAAAPASNIFMVVAVSGAARAAKAAAVNAARSAGDANVWLIDMPAIYASYFGTSLSSANARSYDGVHPTEAENAHILAGVMTQVQHALEPRKYTVIGS